MKSIDHTKTKEFTEFIPTHLLNTETSEGIDNIGQWWIVNTHKENWLDGDWARKVHTIVKLTDNLIVVIWDKQIKNIADVKEYNTTIYKGTIK